MGHNPDIVSAVIPIFATRLLASGTKSLVTIVVVDGNLLVAYPSLANVASGVARFVLRAPRPSTCMMTGQWSSRFHTHGCILPIGTFGCCISGPCIFVTPKPVISFAAGFLRVGGLELNSGSAGFFNFFLELRKWHLSQNARATKTAARTSKNIKNVWRTLRTMPGFSLSIPRLAILAMNMKPFWHGSNGNKPTGIQPQDVSGSIRNEPQKWK